TSAGWSRSPRSSIWRRSCPPAGWSGGWRVWRSVPPARRACSPDRRGTMAKKEQTEDRIPRWELKVEYVESCNCNFGCPCNFSGYPTDGHCEALVGYHVRQGHFGRTRLDGLDVIYAAAWPKAIHQGGGTLRLYVSEAASAEQRDALVRIFSGKAKGSGAFELFASTMADVQPPVFTAIEFTPDGRRSTFRIPGALEVQLAPFTNPVSGEVQDVRVNLPKG